MNNIAFTGVNQFVGSNSELTKIKSFFKKNTFLREYKLETTDKGYKYLREDIYSPTNNNIFPEKTVFLKSEKPSELNAKDGVGVLLTGDEAELLILDNQNMKQQRNYFNSIDEKNSFLDYYLNSINKFLKTPELKRNDFKASEALKQIEEDVFDFNSLK